MLNENLAAIRRSRGLTQEALAAKLHVVRQTVSKWENGAAVPDADTLCAIADALEVPVTDLLGQPSKGGQPDITCIARSLAEINEQLAIRNRRCQRVLRLLLRIVLGLLLLTALVIVLNPSVGRPTITETVTVQTPAS